MAPPAGLPPPAARPAHAATAAEGAPKPAPDTNQPPALAPLGMPQAPLNKGAVWQKESHGGGKGELSGVSLKNTKGTGDLGARYSAAVVDVAQHIAKQGLGFPESMDKMALPITIWQGDGKGRLTLKEGVKPSDAVKHFMTKSAHYKVDCALAQKLVQYAALMQAMGEDKFNAAMEKNGGMALGLFGAKGGALEACLGQMREDKGFDPKKRPPEAAIGERSWVDRNARPGDTVYFDFKGAPDALKRGGWGGENAIALGGGQYFAHPAGVVDKQGLEKEFNKALDRYNKEVAPKAGLPPVPHADFVLMQELGRFDPSALKN